MKFSFFVPLLLAAVGVSADIEDGGKDELKKRHFFPKGTTCKPFLEVTDFREKPEDERWICEFDPSFAKTFGGKFQFEIRGHDLSKMGVISGGRALQIGSSSYVEEDENGNFGPLILQSQVPKSYCMAPGERRRTTGAFKALVVRIVDGANQSTRLDKQSLEDSVFGSSQSLKSVYKDCSYDQVDVQMADIIDLNIPVVAQGTDADIVKAAAVNAISERYGGTKPAQFDFILYCLPPGTYNDGSYDWYAHAYVNRHDSYYNDDACGNISALVHEIGHNLGLAHSRAFNEEYGDASGWMGVSTGSNRCFNAAKSYQLGWYPSKVETVDLNYSPSGSENFNMIGVSDYETAYGLVSLRIVLQGKEWYIGYNRKHGITASTLPTYYQNEEPNKIHLIQKDLSVCGNEYEYGKSERVVALGATESYTWTVGETTVSLSVNNIDGENALINLQWNSPSRFLRLKKR